MKRCDKEVKCHLGGERLSWRLKDLEFEMAEEVGLRQRKVVGSVEKRENGRGGVDGRKREGRGGGWGLGCVGVGVVLLMLGIGGYESRPSVVGDKARLDVFSGERAHKKVRVLAEDIGVRVLGSKENALAGEWIWEEVQKLKTAAEAQGKRVELDRWRSSGSFSLCRQSVKMTYVYTDVENIAVKICGSADCSTGPFVLVNSHFDSASSSPGGSDAGGMIGVMLEMLSNVIHNEKVLVRPLVFLFNGAEEGYLLASHAFLHHPWWKHVGAFVNLESSGAGGSALMFRLGPQKASWLGTSMQRSLRYPHATCASEDVFERGMFPSNTDFMTFAEENGVPGYDFANVRNGQVYHTVLDTADRCAPSFLQHMGENALDLVNDLAGDLDPVLRNAGTAHKFGPLIYFDVIGQFLVTYPQNVGFLGYGMILLLFLRKLSFSTARPLILRAGVGQILGLAAGIGAGAATGFVVGAAGAPMTWYGRILMAPALFIPPAIATFLTVIQFIVGDHKMQPADAFASAGMFYTTILLLFGVFGLRMTYLPAFILLGTTMAAFVTVEGSAGMLLRFFLTFLPIATLGVPASFLPVEVFTAVSGRIGCTANSDVIIGALVAMLTCVFICPLLASLSLVTKDSRRFLIYVHFLLTAVAMVVALQIKVPYTMEKPKRVVANDVVFSEEPDRSGVYLTSVDAITLTSIPLLPSGSLIEDPKEIHGIWSKQGEDKIRTRTKKRKRGMENHCLCFV